MRWIRLLALSAVVMTSSVLSAAPLPRLPQEAREQLAAFARKVLSGEVTAVSDAELKAMHPALRGPLPEQLFVTLFNDRAPAIRFTARAQKNGLIEAAFAAMSKARTLSSFQFYHYDDPRNVVLLFERVADRQTIPPARWVADLSFLNLGVEGIALAHEKREGALPPGEVFPYGIQSRDEFIGRLCTALKLFPKQPKVADPDMIVWDKDKTKVELLSFETFLSRGTSYGVVDLFRMNDLKPEPWKDRLAVARWLGDALAKTQGAGDGQPGQFFTAYDAMLAKYSYQNMDIVDHSFAVLTLCDLSAAAGDRRYLAAAGNGIAFLRKRFLAQKTPKGEPFICVVNDQEAKLGAAAMAVVALDRYASLTGSRFYDDDMKLLGKFLITQQDDDGSFRHYYRYDPKAPFRYRLTNSFPGQATWALALLDKRFGGGEWGKAARKGADYLVTKREEEMHWTETPADPWLACALRELCTPFAVTSYIDYAKKMTAQTLKRQKLTGVSPDMVGSFEGDAEGSVSATALAARLLGEVAAFVDMGADQRDAQLQAMRRAEGFIRLNELRPNNAFYLSDPERAYGLVRSSSFSDDVDMDTACYIIQSLLALDRAEKMAAGK